MAKTATKLDRDEVVDAALALVVRDGPAALTMRRLATELDVGTPTIYWHVGSRDELVAEVMRTQSERLAQRPIEGTTARERVVSAAIHIYEGAVEHRALTSLAHQTGTSRLLLSRLEAVLVDELDAAGLAEQARGDALRAILVVITGALVLSLRDDAGLPEDLVDAVWTGCDVAALTVRTLEAIVAAHVPRREPS